MSPTEGTCEVSQSSTDSQSVSLVTSSAHTSERMAAPQKEPVSFGVCPKDNTPVVTHQMSHPSLSL